MGQNREELKKLLSFIETLTKQPGNEEFVAGLRALLLSNLNIYDKGKLDEIYEYCLEKNSRKQAEDFYKDFPISELIPELIDDFVRMESFKRRGDFKNYSANLFLQIECISNYLCCSGVYDEAFIKLYKKPALIISKNESSEPISMRNKESVPIYKLLFGKFNKTLNDKEKSTILLKDQQIQDKIKIAMYFCGYNTILYNKYEFDEFSRNIQKLYLVRCDADHGGNNSSRTEKQEIIFNDVMAAQGVYYVEFLTLLHLFVTKVSKGYLQNETLLSYVSTIDVIQKKDATISNVLKSGLFVKFNEDFSVHNVPSNAYCYNENFKKDMEVCVTVEDDKIVKVEKKYE